MAEKKDSSFTVTDRRLFTAEGELRKEVTQTSADAVTSPEEPRTEAPTKSPGTTSATAAELSGTPEDIPQMPSATERVELSGHSSKDLEMTFERFMASLYMTAMLQLGLMHEEGGQPRIDIVGARQTIDTLSLLAEKTKGNLTSTEENFLQNCLYELRMAYVEVTNSLGRPPQSAPGSKNIPTAR